MQVLGKASIEGKQKEIILKEERDLFKYYALELIGAYFPQMAEQEIIFKKQLDNNITEEVKRQIVELLKQVNILKILEKMKEQHENIQILGQIEIKGKEKDIILKKEEEYFKYYYLELIGVYTPKMPGETIIFRQDTLENAVSANIKETEQKNKISPTEKEELKQFLERIKIWEIAQKLQMQEQGVKQKTGYDKEMRQNRIKQQEKLQHKKEQEKEQKQQIKKQPKQQNKIKDINIKQEVDMDTRVTDMSNLGQILQDNKKMPKLKNGDEPLKMGIVESDDLKNLKNEKGQKEQGHTSRYEAVVITKKGNVQALDLENDTQEGTNPNERNYQVKQNDEVQKGDVLTRLKLGEGTIGIEKAQYGEVEVYHSPRKTIGGKGIEGNKSLDRQLETSNAKNPVEGTDIDTLKLAQEYNDGYRSVEEGYQEITKHEKRHPDCGEKEAEDLDGKKDTKSHTHPQPQEEYVELSDGEKVSYNQLATRWGFYKDGKPDSEFVKEKFGEKKKEDKKPEEVINELDEEFEDPRASDRRR